MSESVSGSEVTQEDIDAVLLRLQLLREQTERLHAEITPWEYATQQAHDEYQAAIGYLLEENEKLQAEKRLLNNQIEGKVHNLGMYAPDVDLNPSERDLGPRRTSSTPLIVDPEVHEKTALVRHLVRMLDHTSNTDDAKLLSRVQGLLGDSSTRLVDALEQIPWGIVWTERNVQEDLARQHLRLTVWERSYRDQNQHLQHIRDNLRRDGLLQQYQKGTTAWQQFLQQAIVDVQNRNTQLAQEIQQLETRWKAMVDQT